jgi:vacuolar-type H+-ATPase subunit H
MVVDKLKQVRQVELEADGNLEAAQHEASEVVHTARTGADRALEEAKRAGREEGRRLRDGILEEAKAEAEGIEREAQAAIAAIRTQAAANLENATQALLKEVRKL